jgi:hypothetical protein
MNKGINKECETVERIAPTVFFWISLLKKSLESKELLVRICNEAGYMDFTLLLLLNS